MHTLSGNEGRSNSLLEPKLHLERFPEFQPDGTIEVPVVRLDDLLREQAINAEEHPLLVLDVQGFERSVLAGASDYLRDHCRAIVCEVAAVELYKGGALVGEIDSFLRERGFLRVLTKWASGVGGDALYLPLRRLNLISRARISLLGGKGHRPPSREVKRFESDAKRV
jgi:hypothetical protein